MKQYELLEKYFTDNYSTKHYPTMIAQRELWTISRPLEGLRILDATPICRNTIYKFMNLIHSGAQLTVGYGSMSNFDPRTIELLREAQINVVCANEPQMEFDIIMDCAAQFIDHKALLGRVELTRSGTELYMERGEKVYLADAGRIKMIETCIGTGESYFRAMEHLGYKQWAGRRLVVMGSGKVGVGIIREALLRGVEVIVVSDPESIPSWVSEKVAQVVDYRNTEEVLKAALSSYALVSATGLVGSIGRTIDARALVDSGVLLANMGAEDEFGDDFSDNEVLASKGSLNFILDDPTELKYIDATFSLHNYGAQYLVDNPQLGAGVIYPEREFEDLLLKQTRLHGDISKELDELESLF